MIIFPSIGLGWLFPIGKKNRGNNNIGGPYVGAGLGVGFPFFTRVTDAQRQAYLKQKAAGRMAARKGSVSKGSPINDPWERKALYWLLSPLALAHILGSEGIKGGRAVGNGLGRVVSGVKGMGKGVKNAGKAYGKYVTTRNTNFQVQNKPTFTMKSQETVSVSPPTGGAKMVDRPSLQAAVNKQMKSVDKASLETPSSDRPSMGVR